MNKKKSLSELRFDVEKGAQRKKFYENEIKIKKHQIKHLIRTERTHRLCSRGGMLEKFIERPDILSDEQIMKLLTFVFHNKGLFPASLVMIPFSNWHTDLSQKGRYKCLDPGHSIVH